MRKDIAARLKIPVTTLNGIMKGRKKIEEACINGNVNRARVTTGQYPEVETALLNWMRQARTLPVRVPFNGRVLKARAKQAAGTLGFRQFTASEGWLTRFKERHGIKYKKVSGESADVPEETVENWTSVVLPGLLQGYTLKDVYNADEFGLYINMLPDKTMCRKDEPESSKGNKQSKARVTVLLGSNADGSDKLLPLVIGKAKTPRALSGVQRLPCTYTNTDNAWMTGEKYEWWLRKFDCRMRIEKRNVLLFVDNCPAHPAVHGLTNVKVVFLPKNTTSRLQPMDQGVIKNLKHYYRTRLVQRLIGFVGRQDLQRKDFFINMFHVLHFLMWSWGQVTPVTIFNCYRKAGFREVGPDE
ncbi:hypothetical protein FOCC_FOCC016158, partial [Frankliniella occidentalis]